MTPSEGTASAQIPPRPPLPSSRPAADRPGSAARRAEPGRWLVVLGIAGAAAVLVLALAAAITAVPAILANNAGRVSDGTHPFLLSAEGERASILVPAEWVVIRGDDSTIVLRSPDDSLSARVALLPESAESAVTHLVDAESEDADVGAWRHETLGSGLAASHADVVGAADDLLAVVSVGADATGTPVVTVVVDVAEDRDPARYRPAIAEILEGVSR